MPRSYHHGNLKAALIEQGVKLIEERGVKSLTLREIGERTGVSRTAAYRHFPDKAALLAEIRETGFREFFEALKTAIETTDGTVGEKFDAMGLAYVRFADSRRPYYEVMFGVGCDLGDAALGRSQNGEAAFRLLLDTVQAGQAAGEFRSGDPLALANTAWALMHGIAMLRLEPDVNRDGAGTSFLKAAQIILRHGMAASRAGRRPHNFR